MTRIDLVDFASRLDAQADQLVRFMRFIRLMCGLIKKKVTVSNGIIPYFINII